MSDMTYEIERGEYRGNPTIKIKATTSSGFETDLTMGYMKAKAAVDNIEALEAFCIECEEKQSSRGRRR